MTLRFVDPGHAAYRAALRYSRSAVDQLLGRSTGAGAAADAATDLPSIHHAALAARDVAESEFGDLMNSRGSKQVTVDTWSRLVTQPHTVLLGGDWMRRIADRQGRPASEVSAAASVRAAVDALGVAVDRVDAGLSAAADGSNDTAAHADESLDDGPGRDTSAVALADARRAVVALLDDRVATSGLSDRQLLAPLWTLEWFTLLDAMGDDVADELRATRAEVNRSWWR